MQLRCSLGTQATGWGVVLGLRGASFDSWAWGLLGFLLGLLGRGNSTSLGMKGSLQVLGLDTHTHSHTHQYRTIDMQAQGTHISGLWLVEFLPETYRRHRHRKPRMLHKHPFAPWDFPVQELPVHDIAWVSL